MSDEWQFGDWGSGDTGSSPDWMFGGGLGNTPTNWGFDVNTSNIFPSQSTNFNSQPSAGGGMFNFNQNPTYPSSNIFGDGNNSSGFLKGINLNSIVPVALSLLNAFNKPKQAKPSLSPAAGQAYNQAMQIAQGNFNISPTWNKVVDNLMNLNAQRGLTTNATSGALRRSIGEAAPAVMMQYMNPALQTAGNIANQTVYQQPADNWLSRLVQPYTQMVMAANQARAISPYANQAKMDFWPW